MVRLQRLRHNSWLRQLTMDGDVEWHPGHSSRSRKTKRAKSSRPRNFFPKTLSWTRFGQPSIMLSTVNMHGDGHCGLSAIMFQTFLHSDPFLSPPQSGLALRFRIADRARQLYDRQYEPFMRLFDIHHGEYNGDVPKWCQNWVTAIEGRYVWPDSLEFCIIADILGLDICIQVAGVSSVHASMHELMISFGWQLSFAAAFHPIRIKNVLMANWKSDVRPDHYIALVPQHWDFSLLLQSGKPQTALRIVNSLQRMWTLDLTDAFHQKLDRVRADLQQELFLLRALAPTPPTAPNVPPLPSDPRVSETPRPTGSRVPTLSSDPQMPSSSADSSASPAQKRRRPRYKRKHKR